MIGRLHGRLLEKRPPWLTVDVHGVGYELEAPMTTFYKLPATGAEVTLHTHVVVREDAHLLYGFWSERERRLFRSLLKVSGIGARMALAILSGIDADEFAACVESGNTGRLTGVPGIGKKTAERLVLELRDRLTDWERATGHAAVLGAPAADPIGDAISALVALGYKPQEASRYVNAIDTAGMTSEAIIREALKAAVRP